MTVISLSAGNLLAGWWVLIPTAVMIVLAFLGLRLLASLRAQAERELQALYQRDVGLYLERLENNKRLSLVFRRSMLLLYKLEGYMKTGQDDKILPIIRQMDGMRLPPRDKLLFCQQRLSYFVSVRDREQAMASREALADLLKKSRADRTERYQKVLRDADQIIGVFLDRDAELLPVLTREAAEAADPTQRGILQYRIAVLYHFAGDESKVQTYLKRAAKNLKNTYYSVMIKEALQDPAALERQ